MYAVRTALEKYSGPSFLTQIPVFVRGEAARPSRVRIMITEEGTHINNPNHNNPNNTMVIL